MAGTISMGARREVLSAVAERYRSAGRVEKGRILDALCRTTGWHRKHAVRDCGGASSTRQFRTPPRVSASARYGATIKDALTTFVGDVGSCVRQAARGDDPDLCADT